jgi:hypothetical protein
MIKRDLNAWNFVENKPKKKRNIISDYPVDGGTLVYDGHMEWTTTVTDHNIIQLGYNNEGLRIDNSNTVTISDLVVVGSADIPPSQGQLRYNTENQTTEAYVDGEWLELGPLTHYPLPRESKWDRFRNFFRDLLA